jgi:hypothetical protein
MRALTYGKAVMATALIPGTSHGRRSERCTRLGRRSLSPSFAVRESPFRARMRALPYGKAVMPPAQIRGTPMVVGREGCTGATDTGA